MLGISCRPRIRKSNYTNLSKFLVKQFLRKHINLTNKITIATCSDLMHIAQVLFGLICNHDTGQFTTNSLIFNVLKISITDGHGAAKCWTESKYLYGISGCLKLNSLITIMLSAYQNYFYTSTTRPDKNRYIENKSRDNTRCWYAWTQLKALLLASIIKQVYWYAPGPILA